MASKVFLLTLLVVGTSGREYLEYQGLSSAPEYQGLSSAPEYQGLSSAPEYQGHSSAPEYSFHYGVSDPHSGDDKEHLESRLGHSLTGRYSLVEPDGGRRVVEYSVDGESGFNAHVRREPSVTSTAQGRGHLYPGSTQQSGTSTAQGRDHLYPDSTQQSGTSTAQGRGLLYPASTQPLQDAGVGVVLPGFTYTAQLPLVGHDTAHAQPEQVYSSHHAQTNLDRPSTQSDLNSHAQGISSQYTLRDAQSDSETLSQVDGQNSYSARSAQSTDQTSAQGGVQYATAQSYNRHTGNTNSASSQPSRNTAAYDNNSIYARTSQNSRNAQRGNHDSGNYAGSSLQSGNMASYNQESSFSNNSPPSSGSVQSYTHYFGDYASPDAQRSGHDQTYNRDSGNGADTPSPQTPGTTVSYDSNSNFAHLAQSTRNGQSYTQNFGRQATSQASNSASLAFYRDDSNSNLARSSANGQSFSYDGNYANPQTAGNSRSNDPENYLRAAQNTRNHLTSESSADSDYSRENAESQYAEEEARSGSYGQRLSGHVWGNAFSGGDRMSGVLGPSRQRGGERSHAGRSGQGNGQGSRVVYDDQSHAHNAQSDSQAGNQYSRYSQSQVYQSDSQSNTGSAQGRFDSQDSQDYSGLQRQALFMPHLESFQAYSVQQPYQSSGRLDLNTRPSSQTTSSQQTYARQEANEPSARNFLSSSQSSGAEAYSPTSSRTLGSSRVGLPAGHQSSRLLHSYLPSFF